MQNTNNVSREESTRRGTTILFTCEGFTLITRVKISRVINADGLVGHTHPNLPRVNNGKIRLDEEDLYTLFIGHTIGEGDASSIAFALGERLVDILNSRLMDFKFTKLVCPSANWPSLSTELQRKYGFKTKDFRCIVWTVSGRIIGDQDDFVKYCKEIYNVECDVDEVTLFDVADENKATCDSMFEKDLAVEADEEFAHIVVNSWEKSEF